MKLLDDYLALEKQLHDYFGYVEDWRVIPLDDARDYFWHLDQRADGGGTVGFAETEEELRAWRGWRFPIPRFLHWLWRGGLR